MESKNSWRVFGITFLIIACVVALAVIRPSLSAAEIGALVMAIGLTAERLTG